MNDPYDGIIKLKIVVGAIHESPAEFYQRKRNDTQVVPYKWYSKTPLQYIYIKLLNIYIRFAMRNTAIIHY